MVQFCPKCGTKAPDNESVFCNKCGTRLPPVILEKPDIICPRCKTKFLDEQSVFCNKCGSPLERTPPVQVQQAAILPPQAPLIKKKERCPSCGAPLVDEQSGFCNKCGSPLQGIPPVHIQQAEIRPAAVEWPALKEKRCLSCGAPLPHENTDYCDACAAHLRGPEPVSTVPEAREPVISRQKKTAPASLVADGSNPGTGTPAKKRNWRSLAGIGLIAVVVIICIVGAAAFMTGMIPGMNQSAATNTTLDVQDPVTALPTQKTTKTTAPTVTPTPSKVITTPVPKTTIKTNASANITTNASAPLKTNTSANMTANASVTVKPTPVLSNFSKTFSIGETATDGNAKVTVNGITLKDKMMDPIPSYAIGKKYMIVDITYENLLNDTVSINTNGMLLKDGGGYTFDPVTNDVMLENPLYIMGRSVSPLEKKTGNMLFIVPPGATYLKFQYDFGEQNIATFQIN